VTSDFLIERQTTSHQVAATLRASIMRGELPPGTRLREIALAETLGVSRNIVREGFRILAAEGLVRHNIHRGVMVATPEPHDIEEIAMIRRLLELAALGKSDVSVGQRLEAIVTDVQVALEQSDRRRVYDLDLDFHRELVGTLRNSRILEFFTNTFAELRLAFILLDKSDDDAKKWIGVHREIALLIQAEDRKTARRVLEGHLRDTLSSLLAMLEEKQTSA
jgi:DNA-binding GntR family transcriptional regulator